MKRRWQSQQGSSGTSGRQKQQSEKVEKGGLKGKVAKGTPEHRAERRRYLTQLINEFHDEATTLKAKQEVLANLANFAYDPYNYRFFQELHIVQIFLDELENEADSELMEFSLGGICNCVADYTLGTLILDGGGVPFLKRSLASAASTTFILHSLTSLWYLAQHNRDRNQTGSWISELVPETVNFEQHEDLRIRNIAKLFLKQFSQ